MSSRTRTVLVAAPLSAVLLLSACSSGSSGGSETLSVTFKDAAAATSAAGPAGTNGNAQGPAGAQGPVKGVVDGDLTGSGLVTATLFSGTTRSDIEIRWRDEMLYVKRAETDPSAQARAGTAAWMMRAPTDRAWAKRGIRSQFTPDLFSPFAPAALADLLVQREVPAEVTHDGSQRKLHGKNKLPILGAWTQATVDLWVDANDRITKVQISSADGGMSYDVHYGGSAPHVDVPPSGEILQPGSFTPKPAGPFVTVQSGNDDGVAWSLQRAPGTRGYECWRWQANPPVKIVAADATGIRCVPVLDPTDDPSTQAQFVASSDGKGKYDVLAIRLPVNARSVGVSPVLGRPTTKPVSGDTFVWVGPIADKAGFAFVSVAGGPRLACGPGWISTPSDWSTVGAAEKARLMAAPWVCT